MNDIETLQSLLPRLVHFGERPALIAFSKSDLERWSYQKLARQAQRLAAGLSQAGVHQGDPVVLCAENSPQWLSACLGIIQAGAVVVPLDNQLGDDVLRHVLHDSGSRVVFTTSRLLKRVRRAMGRRRSELFLLDDGETNSRSWQDLLSDSPAPDVNVSPHDQAVLFYTSGTTGPPKGVPLTHRNLAFQLQTLLAADLVKSSDRVLLPLPLHHVYPFTIGVLTPLALGLPIILPYTLTGPQLLRALHDGQVTIVIGVPRLYRALLAGIQSQAASQGRLMNALFHGLLAASRLSARLKIRVGRLLFRGIHRRMGGELRVLASGGAAMEPNLAWDLEALGWLLGTGYGLTETSPLVTLDKPGQARIGSVGRVIPGVEVRIDPVVSDDRARRATQDEFGQQPREGEIVVRGPSVFAGYHELPEKTKEAFTADGWFRTGDLGYFDRDRYLYVAGRVKTLIVLEGGEKVQPDDVEEKYQASAAIAEAGVLERDGKLAAVIRPGRAARQEEDRRPENDRAIRSALEERSRSLPSYQRIADFVVTGEPLPRTRLGKIRREELRELYERIKAGRAEPKKVGPITEAEMTGDDRALLDEPAARKTWEWLAKRFSKHRLTPDTSPQLDLGIDSLEWLNLTLEIRQCCNVELSEEAIGRIETVRDLLREVAERPEAGKGGRAVDPLKHPEEVLGQERNRWLTPLGPVESAAAWCLYMLDWILVHTAYRLNVEGLERLPRKAPFVLAPNHVSYLDSFVLAAALDFKLLRQTYWAGWTGVAFGPVFRLLRRLCHVVPIDPDKAAASSLAFAAAVLRTRQNMVWYPEGGHSKTGELLPLKPGIGMLLEQYPVPVVPVHLEGTRESLPPGRMLPRPGRIHIKLGAPLDPRELMKKGSGETPHERITAALADELAKLGRRLSVPQEARRLHHSRRRRTKHA